MPGLATLPLQEDRQPRYPFMASMDNLDLNRTIETASGEGTHAPSLSPGSTLGQYRIVRLLGRGGMGEVYEAEHVQMQKRYALKLLPAAATCSATFLDRFRVEARVMADLKHPGIVGVHHMDQQEGLYYLTMDYVAGLDGNPRTLEDLLAKGKLPEKRVRELALELCEALAHAHRHHVIHRDLKPANILLDAEGHARITDFGLAKVVGSEYLQSMIQRSVQLSMAGAVSMGEKRTLDGSGSGRPSSSARALLGTYDYMAPEQKDGGEITERTDIYALGVVLYRMLTGRKPEGRWEVPSHYGCSREWDTVVVKCMKPEPKDRWSSIAELRRLIADGANNARRRGLWLGLAAAGLVLGGLVAVPVVLRQVEESRQRELAAAAATREQAERATKVQAALGEAERQVAADKLDEALTSLATVEKLEPGNGRAGKLKEQIEARAGERRARPAKVDADMAWEKLKARKLDEGQGMGSRLADVERQWRLAADAYGLSKWGEAYTGYQAVLRLVKEVEGQETSREGAKARRDESAKARQAAAMAGAAELAAEEWQRAKGEEARAGEQFEKGEFEGAGKAWQGAGGAWAAARTVAEQVRAYRSARSAFEAALKSASSVLSVAELSTHGGAAWEAVERQRRLGEASGNDPKVGEVAYEAALAKLPEAVQTAQAGKKVAEERAARAQALVEYQSVLGSAKAALEQARGMAKTDREGPAVVKEGLAVIAGFEGTEPYGLLGSVEKRTLEGVKADLAGAGKKFQSGPDLEKSWSNSLGMEFVPVPGTEVLWCKWDVRVQDFEAFVEATGYDATAGMVSLRSDGWKQRGDTWKSPGFSQGPTHPVCGVSWDDAKAFCKWLTEKERREGRLRATQEYRLPRDWEWSVAVGLDEPRGGTPRGKDGKVQGVYPWGTQWPPPSGAGNYAGDEAKDGNWPSNYVVIDGNDDGYARTSPVGSFGANRYGLYDMGGNVWQWCEDYYDGQGGARVLRGGSWGDFNPASLLSSYRFCARPDYRCGNRGFRVVVSSVE